MAKVKFGRDDMADLCDMADDGELPDRDRIFHLLSKGRLLGEYDDD